MIYTEIELYDIRNNPTKAISAMETNARHLTNDLYILSEGNHYSFDKDTLSTLESLKKSIEKVLTNQN